MAEQDGFLTHHFERAVYDEVKDLWFRSGDSHNLNPGIAATSYPEAFEKLYGHAPITPPLERAVRRPMFD